MMLHARRMMLALAAGIVAMSAGTYAQDNLDCKDGWQS
jgi:hypothetical protein